MIPLTAATEIVIAVRSAPFSGFGWCGCQHVPSALALGETGWAMTCGGNLVSIPGSLWACVVCGHVTADPELLGNT